MYGWLALIGVALILILLFSLKGTNSTEVIFDGGEMLEITDVYVISVRGGRVQLNEQERAEFISLVEDASYNKKLIPNVSKFNMDFHIDISYSNGDNKQFRFELEREILAEEITSNKLDQYYLEDNGKFATFIKQYSGQ